MNSSFNQQDFDNYIVGVEGEPLNNATIQKVANHLITWEELARFLQLSDSEEKEIKRNYQHDYKEQKYQCIKYWAKKNGKTATLINLLQQIYFNLKDKHLVMSIVQDLQHDTKPLGDDKENISPTDEASPKWKEDDNWLWDWWKCATFKM